MKILGYIAIVGVLGLIGYSLGEFAKYQNQCEVYEKTVQQTPSAQFSLMVENDFNEELRQMPDLLPFWGSLKSIEYEYSGNLGKMLLKNRKPKLPIAQNGEYRLTVLIVDIDDEKQPSILFQMSFFEIKSNNKKFEIARTYDISKFNF